MSVVEKLIPKQDHVSPRDKLNFFTRNKRHNEFMKTTSNDLAGFVKWVEDFYCDQYLLPYCEKDKATRLKRAAILLHLENHPPKPGQTIQNYLMWKPEASLTQSFPPKSLAELIGENRKSKSATKDPWGLKKIIETFKYQKIKGDNTPYQQYSRH